MDFEIGLNKNSFPIKTGQKLKEHRTFANVLWLVTTCSTEGYNIWAEVMQMLCNMGCCVIITDPLIFNLGLCSSENWRPKSRWNP